MKTSPAADLLYHLFIQMSLLSMHRFRTGFWNILASVGLLNTLKTQSLQWLKFWNINKVIDWIGGVVAYPVKQVYGGLALEDNSKVSDAVLDRCSISCVCTSAFYLPAKEVDPDPKLAMGPSWILRGCDDTPSWEVGDCRFYSRNDQLRKDLDWSWNTSSWLLRPTLVP